MQDLNELSRLRADQIQHVDVVQNPGARYAASTKAVVRITLKKALVATVTLSRCRRTN